MSDSCEYKCHRGLIWHPYGVDFDSPDGKFSVQIWAISYEHAELQLAALKETGRIYGRIHAVIDAGKG